METRFQRQKLKIFVNQRTRPKKRTKQTSNLLPSCPPQQQQQTKRMEKQQHTHTNIARNKNLGFESLDQTHQHIKDLLVTNERKKNLRRSVARMNVKDATLIFVAPTNERRRRKKARFYRQLKMRERDRRTHTHTYARDDSN